MTRTPPRDIPILPEKPEDALRAAIRAHVPDGYDQVEPGWPGALRRECLQHVDALALCFQAVQDIRDVLYIFVTGGCTAEWALTEIGNDLPSEEAICA